MAEPIDKIRLRFLGQAVEFIFGSNAAKPVIIFYFIFSAFCVILKEGEFWKAMSPWFIFSILGLWVVSPDRLRSEQHIRDMRKLELLGQKGKQLPSQEIPKLYQPQTIRQTISAKASIIKTNSI